MTADSTKRSQEHCCLQSLTQCSQRSVGSKYIVQLLDEFRHQRPNGVHQCLVFELLGPSVDAVLENYHRAEDCLEPKTVLKMSKQLLQGLAFLHEEGYSHGGMTEHGPFIILLLRNQASLLFRACK